MDRLGTQRTRSVGFVPASPTKLLSEFSRSLQHFSLVQGDEMQNPGIMGKMVNQFELVFAAWLLYHGVQKFHSLKSVFLELRSCLHPPCCVGGQLRHLATVEHPKSLQ